MKPLGSSAFWRVRGCIMCESPSFEPCSDSEDGSLDDSHHVWKPRREDCAHYISLRSYKSCCVMWNLGKLAWACRLQLDFLCG